MDDSGFNGCQDNIVYTYTFTDCAGHSHNWIYTYVIELPALTVPQTGSGIVACANEAVTPTPDTLTDACGREVTATPDASNPTVDIAADGHGTVTYSYTYTDCAGNAYPWQFVYTVTPGDFTPVADADTTVHCAGDVFTPATPTVEVCEQVISFNLEGATFVTNSGCGDSVYTFNYTVNGNDYTWTYTYHIVPEDFTVSAASGETTVSCMAQVSADSISLPTVTDACNSTLTPGEPTVDSTGFNGCQGDVLYTYTYTDCAGHSHTWSHTFHIVMPDAIANVPADGGSSVPCLVDVAAPTAAAITDICGRTIEPVFVDSTATLSPDGTGTVVFRYRYTDCTGNDSLWTYTYTLNPNDFSPAQNDTTTVHCLSEVVAPTLPNITNCGASVTLEPGTNTSTLSNGCGDTTSSTARATPGATPTM